MIETEALSIWDGAARPAIGFVSAQRRLQSAIQRLAVGPRPSVASSWRVPTTVAISMISREATHAIQRHFLIARSGERIRHLREARKQFWLIHDEFCAQPPGRQKPFSHCSCPDRSRVQIQLKRLQHLTVVSSSQCSLATVARSPFIATERRLSLKLNLSVTATQPKSNRAKITAPPAPRTLIDEFGEDNSPLKANQADQDKKNFHLRLALLHLI